MDYPGNKSPDEFMAKIVKALKKEILRGEAYPLMARYSQRTCDRKYLKGRDYVCVNIKVDCNGNTEIFAVDIYPTGKNNSIVLSLFRRKVLKSLYKMTGGSKGEDKSVIEIITNGHLNDFVESGNDYRRREWSIDLDRSKDFTNETVNDDKSAKVVKVLRKIIKVVREVYSGEDKDGASCGAK